MNELDRLKEKLDAAQAEQSGSRSELKSSADADNMSTGLRAGSELVVSILASAALGYELDKWLGTRPWCMIGLTFLGICAGFMGVDRISGDVLSFGGVAASVIEKSEVSVLLVSSGDSEEKRGGAREA